MYLFLGRACLSSHCCAVQGLARAVPWAAALPPILLAAPLVSAALRSFVS